MAYAQPTITSSWAPVPNESQFIQHADTAGISEGNAGASQNWNFSTLTASESVREITYISPTGTKYASIFPTATLASYDATIFANSGYSYYKADSTGLNFLGIGTIGFNLVSSDPRLHMKFPFTYQDSYTDVYKSSYTSHGVDVFRTGLITCVGDAYGTITTPVGIFNGVLRVKVVDNFFDTSVFMGSTNRTVMTTITTYYWILPTLKSPVVQITYIAQAENGNTFYAKGANYYPGGPLGIKEVNTSSIKVALSPNPAVDFAQAGFVLESSSSIRFEITEISGRCVSSQSFGELNAGMNSVDLDCNNLNAGLYLVRMFADNIPTTAYKMQIK